MNQKRNFRETAEIVQQELSQVLAEIDEEHVHEFLQLLIEADRIFIAGKGRTGLQMRSFAMRLMHLGLPVFVVGDVTTPGIESGDLLVIGTASGKTQSLIAYAETAARIGTRMISITSHSENPISKLSSAHLIIPAPSHKNDAGIKTIPSIQPLGGLFELALGVLLNIMVLHLVDKMGVDESKMITRHANLE